jgi:hypothetical protein
MSTQPVQTGFGCQPERWSRACAHLIELKTAVTFSLSHAESVVSGGPSAGLKMPGGGVRRDELGDQCPRAKRVRKGRWHAARRGWKKGTGKGFVESRVAEARPSSTAFAADPRLPVRRDGARRPNDARWCLIGASSLSASHDWAHYVRRGTARIRDHSQRSTNTRSTE